MAGGCQWQKAEVGLGWSFGQEGLEAKGPGAGTKGPGAVFIPRVIG